MSVNPLGETRAKECEDRQGGGVNSLLSGGDEWNEPESANSFPSSESVPKVYHLKRSLAYRHVPKLDCSDYPGETVYRASPIVDMAAGAAGGGAAAASPPGLSNSHIQSLLSMVRQKAQVEIWRGGSLVHCQREKELPAVAPTKRGTVHGFSRKSRNRMIATQGKILWNTEKLPYFMGNTCPDTVSYTHLDVYKRQTVLCPHCGLETIIFVPEQKVSATNPDILDLNPSQLAASTFNGGHALVLAGAGCGKTKTIIARCEHLIANGVPASRIYVMTFTRKAAAEITSRVSAKFGSAAKELKASTFHSFCMAFA